MTVTVKIESAYSDGHESERTIEIENPNTDDLSEWWELEVYQHTGDGHGHGIDYAGGSFYGATIIAADDPNLVGATYEWVD